MSEKLRIAGVVGARPNFMKIAPLRAELERWPEDFEFTLVHTGQHYDRKMNDVFFSELNIPEPDVHLGIGSGTHAEQTAGVMVAFERFLLGNPHHLVLVVGDVNSTLAASLVAAKMHVPVAHVEAGLRSGDRRMPEEINRIVTDSLSDILFTTSTLADRNLLAEGVASSRISLVGNIMIDTLIANLENARQLDTVKNLGLSPGRFGLVTLHRPALVDDREKLEEVLNALADISTKLPIMFPVHPRTEKRIEEFGLENIFAGCDGLKRTAPLGYLDFLALMSSSALVISDSGGIQEETTYLKIPCLTLRENTERPETIELGTNTLLGFDTARLRSCAAEITAGRGKKGSDLEYWDGKVSQRIAAELKKRRSWLMSSVDSRLGPGAKA